MPVRLVEILVVGDDRDALAPHAAFQIHAGVDAIVAGVDAGETESLAVLEPYVEQGRAQAVERPAGADEDDVAQRTRARRRARP